MIMVVQAGVRPACVSMIKSCLGIEFVISLFFVFWLVSYRVGVSWCECDVESQSGSVECDVESQSCNVF